MQPLISVIIPAYNNEADIAAAIDSVLAQSYPAWELIVVNDGSADGTGAICDDYAARDSRIRVIHKKNAGVSAARNTGLSMMEGAFVTFLDGDDELTPDGLENLYCGVNGTGALLSCCGQVKHAAGGYVYNKFIREDAARVTCVTGRQAAIGMFYGDLISASAGCKLYKKELFDRKFNFSTDLVMGEDTYFAYRCFREAPLVAIVNAPCYVYNYNETGVTNKKTNFIKFYDYVRMYDAVLREDPWPGDKEFRRALLSRLVENNFWALMKLRQDETPYPEEIAHIEDNIRAYRADVIRNPKAQKRVRYACALSYAGFSSLFLFYDLFDV